MLLRNTKIYCNFAGVGAFLASGDNFSKSPLICLRPRHESPQLTPSPMGTENPPQKQLPPPKILFQTSIRLFLTFDPSFDLHSLMRKLILPPRKKYLFILNRLFYRVCVPVQVNWVRAYTHCRIGLPATFETNIQ